MTEQALDDLARRVMLDAVRREHGDLMEELPEHTFSPAFERRMKKLVRRHSLRHKVLRAAACLLLAAFLSGCAVLAVSPEAREVFTGWVREVYETSFVYRFPETDQKAPARVLYRPACIPAGFETEKEIVTHDMVTLVYKNNAGELLFFSSSLSGSSPVIQIVRDGTEMYKQASVNGMPAELYLDRDEGEANILIWTDEEGTIFWISSALGETELLRIAESAEAVPATWRPTWLPEGYEAFDEKPGVPAYNSYMLDDKCIDLTVLEGIESAAIYVTMEEGDIEKQVVVSGRPADLYLGAEGGNRTLIWADDKEGLAFMLITGPEIPEEEMLRIAESVRPAFAAEQPHRPAWIPDEYVQRGRSGGMKCIKLHYDKDNGEQILFRYWADGYGSRLPEEMEEAIHNLPPESALVNGLEARLYADAGGINHLVWHDGDDTYWITAPLTGGELIKIAESVGQLSKTPK